MGLHRALPWVCEIYRMDCSGFVRLLQNVSKGDCEGLQGFVRIGKGGSKGGRERVVSGHR